MTEVQEIGPKEILTECSRIAWKNYGINIDKLTQTDIVDISNILTMVQRARMQTKYGL